MFSVSIHDGLSIIDRILPRANLFARKEVYGGRELQPIAANVDRLFITVAVNRDFNLRRIERYIIAAGAFSVPYAVALTKIDSVEDPDRLWKRCSPLPQVVRLWSLSATEMKGLDSLVPFRGSRKRLLLLALAVWESPR